MTLWTNRVTRQDGSITRVLRRVSSQSVTWTLPLVHFIVLLYRFFPGSPVLFSVYNHRIKEVWIHQTEYHRLCNIITFMVSNTFKVFLFRQGILSHRITERFLDLDSQNPSRFDPRILNEVLSPLSL